MSEATNLFSPHWYRVADLKPRLRGHVEVTRHSLRGELWYLLRDQITGQHHRFNSAAYFLISQFDGKRTMQDIWDEAINALNQKAPSQEHCIELLTKLHQSDLLTTNREGYHQEQDNRQHKQEFTQWKTKLLSPLSIRVPLVDPERFLQRTLWVVKPFFSLFGVFVWLAIVGLAALKAVSHWPELSQNVVDSVLSPSNLVLLWFLFPFVKLLHELGHAYATKKWGGEVHDIGIMFLVFMPVPYVDASAASSFERRYQRMVVGAAGMIVEVFIAAIALHLWLELEMGLARTLLYNVMLIAGVSTLLFNANPLLKFDGYYIFSDLIEIPNLATRANQYLTYLVKRYALLIDGVKSPASAKGEPVWFLFYSIASFFYRAFITFVIATFLAQKFFFIGVALALFAIFNMFILPVIKQIRFLMFNSALTYRRARAWVLVIGVLAGAGYFLFYVPLPSSTLVQGVVQPPDDALVRTRSDCLVDSWLVEPDTMVSVGQPIIRCVDSNLSTQIQIEQYRIEELRVRYLQLRFEEQTQQAELVQAELSNVIGNLKYLEGLKEDLTIKSPSEGKLTMSRPQDLPGQFFKQGATIAYVMSPQVVRLRVAITQNDIEQVRSDNRRVEVMFNGVEQDILNARMVREVPGAQQSLPSKALGHLAGGEISVDPRSPEGRETFQRIFIYDIELSDHIALEHYGSRAWVRFIHPDEPLGGRIYRRIRQNFLGEFGV